MLRSTTLAIFRSGLLAVLALCIIVGQTLALAFRLDRAARRLPTLWLLMCRRIIGMDVRVNGTPLARDPVLFVSNHTSYLDIAALGSIVPGSFVARGDIRHWPLFGYLARLQRTVFIERQVNHARRHLDELKRRLEQGDSLILFPEGTSSDGNTVLPFKSSLFEVANEAYGGAPIPVQPISIAYTRLDGLPLGRLMRPVYAWYGDMGFISHFWRLLGHGRFRVELIFHPPVTIGQFASRKDLARHCERAVAHGFSRLLAGRYAPEAAVPPADSLLPVQAPA